MNGGPRGHRRLLEVILHFKSIISFNDSIGCWSFCPSRLPTKSEETWLVTNGHLVLGITYPLHLDKRLPRLARARPQSLASVNPASRKSIAFSSRKIAWCRNDGNSRSLPGLKPCIYSLSR